MAERHGSQRVRELFQKALDLPRSEREDMLREECGEDRALFDELCTLLEHTPELDADTGLPTGGFAMQVLLLPPGTAVGPFTVERHLGSGASSDVYLATQQQPRRSVALKVLRVGAAKDLSERFERESTALAWLNHPNVAQVFQIGRADDDRPWIAMELVSGRTITAYARHARLDLRARLRLFVTLCDALEHIHQNGLIHRDLKPDNVVVPDKSDPPGVKVLDFGIAKAVPGIAAWSAGPTVDGSLLGTLEYASPEQLVDSRHVDVRSDLYSAGVILQELLTGTRPFHAATAGLVGFVDRVRNEDAATPSETLRHDPPRLAAAARDVGLAPAALLHALDEDLDWIVLRCLRREPHERYPSAGELRADIRRSLDGYPVSARPPGRGYRMRKFVRKHRTGVLAASLVTLALLAGFVSTAIQFGLATRRLRSLESLTADLISSVNEIQDIPGAMEAKGRLAGSAAQALEQLGSRTLGLDGRRRLADAYERLGQLRGDSYSASLGQVVEGAADLWRALELRREVLSAARDSTAEREYLHTGYLLALVAQAGAPVNSDSLLRALREEGERFTRARPADYRLQGELASVEDLLSEFHSEAGRWREATTLARSAYERRLEAARRDPASEAAQRDLSQSLGRLSYGEPDPDTANVLALRALRIEEAIHERHPMSYRANLELTYALRNRAYTLHRVDSSAAALEDYRRIVAIRRELARSDTTEPRSLHQYRLGLLFLAGGWLAVGRADSAVAMARLAHEDGRRIMARVPLPTWAPSEDFDSYRPLARAEARSGHAAEALAAYARLCETSIGVAAPQLLRRWRDFDERGHLLLRLGRAAEADSVFAASIGILTECEQRLRSAKSDPVPFSDVAFALLHLAQVRAMHASAAEDYLSRAGALPGIGEDDRDPLALIENEWGCQLAARGERDSSARLLADAEKHARRPEVRRVVAENLRRALAATAADGRSAKRFVLAYSPVGDPYDRLDLLMFRHYPVWGDMPAPPPRSLALEH